MLKLVFVDDERNVEDVTWIQYPENLEVTILRTFEDFKKHIESISQYDVGCTIYSFDHDLQDFDENGVEYTGLSCAKHLIETLADKEIEYQGTLMYLSHSQNPCGRQNIEGFLDQMAKVDARCDGCGHVGPDVYHDGYGFNICRTNGCTQYSVRGLSPSDFL